MVELFLETGEKGEGFRVLIHRVKRAELLIMEDFDLMLKLLMKANSVRV